MDRDPTIRVVLGEAEPSFCLLQFVLEGEGIDIVGRAGDDVELERVLRDASVSVVVLDAGISATAAMRVRELAPSAALVVVWPPDAVAIMAYDRVDPDTAVEDLGHVVRRAAASRAAASDAARAATTVAAPMSTVVLRSTAPSSTVRSSRRRKHRTVLAAAMMLTLYAVALSTIAVAITGGFGASRGGRAPSFTPHANVTEADAVTAPGFAADAAVSAVPSAGDRREDIAPGRDGSQERRVQRDPGNEPSDEGPGNGNSNAGGNGNGHGNGNGNPNANAGGNGNANAGGNGNGNANAGGNGNGNANAGGNGNGNANAGGNGNGNANAGGNGNGNANAGGNGNGNGNGNGRAHGADRSDAPTENGNRGGDRGERRRDRSRRDADSRVGSRRSVDRREVTTNVTASRFLGAGRTP